MMYKQKKKKKKDRRNVIFFENGRKCDSWAIKMRGITNVRKYKRSEEIFEYIKNKEETRIVQT